MGFTGNNTSLIALLLLFLFVGGALLVAFTGDRIKTSEAELPLGAIEYAKEKAAAQTSNQDTDKDGLKDWEETLWGTDPLNNDTDGDGTDDGSEVDQDRNPAMEGPDDTIDLSKDIPTQNQEDVELTATEKVAAIFFKEYVTLRQSGGLNDPAAQAELLQKIVAQFNEVAKAPQHTLNDILVGPLSGTESARSYGNLVAVAIEQNPLPGNTPALNLLLSALEQDDPKQLEVLAVYEKAYRGIEDSLLQIVVSTEAAPLHLALVNQFTALRWQVESMQQAFEDPVVMMHAVNPHVESSRALLDTLGRLQSYLKLHHVTYETSEPGWFLVNMPLSQ